LHLLWFINEKENIERRVLSPPLQMINQHFVQCVQYALLKSVFVINFKWNELWMFMFTIVIWKVSLFSDFHFLWMTAFWHFCSFNKVAISYCYRLSFFLQIGYCMIPFFVHQQKHVFLFPLASSLTLSSSSNTSKNVSFCKTLIDDDCRSKDTNIIGNF